MYEKEDNLILIVDDLFAVRTQIRKTLYANGFQNFIEAHNGETALEKLSQYPVKLMILDWMMPVMNGLQVLKTVKSTPRYKDLLVLMVTAEGYPENIISAVRAGANDFIVKPFEPAFLVERVERLFEPQASAGFRPAPPNRHLNLP